MANIFYKVKPFQFIPKYVKIRTEERITGEFYAAETLV